MNKWSLLRITAFALVAGLCMLFTINFASSMVNNSIVRPIDTENIHDILIDDADFTPAFRLLGHSLNSFMAFLILVVNLVVIAVVSIICCTFFRIAAIRRTTLIGSAEMNAARSIFFGSAGTALVVSLVITGFTCIIPLMLHLGIWWLNLWLICYLPIRDHFREEELPAV
jgi:hypothetical protein